MQPMFDFASERVHWFPSHMRAAIETMHRLRARADVVVEVRDARVPHASANPILRDVLPRQQRIVVYNKTDLADHDANALLSRRCEEWSTISPTLQYRLLSAVEDTNSPAGYRSLHALITETASAILDGRLAECQDTEMVKPVRLLVVGVPNVGKSTLINRLRILGHQDSGRKAVATGAIAGVTRSVSGLVRVAAVERAGTEHVVYVHDTPGVLLPRIDSGEQGLALALTGAVMDTTIDGHLLVDYMHHVLEWQVHRRPCAAGSDRPAALHPIAAHYGLRPDYGDVVGLLNGIAQRIRAVNPRDGTPNRASAVAHVLKAFRTGALGHYTLEDIQPYDSALEGSTELAPRTLRRKRS